MKYYELSSTLVKYPFTNPFNRDALTATEWRQLLSFHLESSTTINFKVRLKTLEKWYQTVTTKLVFRNNYYWGSGLEIC